SRPSATTKNVCRSGCFTRGSGNGAGAAEGDGTNRRMSSVADPAAAPRVQAMTALSTDACGSRVVAITLVVLVSANVTGPTHGHRAESRPTATLRARLTTTIPTTRAVLSLVPNSRMARSLSDAAPTSTVSLATDATGVGQ